jgi:hypothetical protein
MLPDTRSASFVIARSVSDEAIHGVASGTVDCFASLAMTGSYSFATTGFGGNPVQPPA